MTSTTRTLRTLAFASLLCVSTTQAAEETPPLDCPQCGAWSLTWSVPSGVIGERLVVASEHMSIPMCGEFRPHVAASLTRTDAGGGRAYQVMMTLSGGARSACAAAADDVDALLAKVNIRTGYSGDGGVADFEIVDKRDGKTLLRVSGWNYERDNPCDSGGSIGSNACLQVAYAELQRQLVQSALAANPNFRIGRVQDAAERACRGKGQDAGGSWPMYWEKSCQWELLEVKLEEFSSFHECVQNSARTCRVPDENVARPSDETP